MGLVNFIETMKNLLPPKYDAKVEKEPQFLVYIVDTHYSLFWNSILKKVFLEEWGSFFKSVRKGKTLRLRSPPNPVPMRNYEHHLFLNCALARFGSKSLFVALSRPAPRLIANIFVFEPFLNGKSLFLINCGAHVSKAACRALSYAPFLPQVSRRLLVAFKVSFPPW